MDPVLIDKYYCNWLKLMLEPRESLFFLDTGRTCQPADE